MNGPNGIEERLRKIRSTTPSEADEQILSDAAAEFKRASKVQAGRPWRIIVSGVIIILLTAAVVFLMRRGEVKRERPVVTPRLEAIQQPVQAEKPEQPAIQPAPKRSEITQQNKPVREQSGVNSAQAKLARISSLAAAGDVNGLAAILKTGDFASKIAAVGFLLRMPDPRAAAALDELAEQLDPNKPEDQLLAEALGIENFGIPEEEIEKAEAKAKAETAAEPNKPAAEVQAKTVTEPNKPAVEEKQPSEQYVTGWLTDENGYAVEGTIQVGEVNTITDANSAFSTERPKAASFGYAVSTDGQIGAIFRWDKNEDLNDIEIVCVPFASASGSVIDVNGQPVSDFHIEIVPEVNEQPAYARGEFKGPWEIKMETDGSFEITSIPTGYPLVLIVSKKGLSRRIPLDEPEPGEHLLLGEIVLEGSLEEDTISEQG
jgi:hypothetical protein